jgi:hypothetical protein
MLSSSDSIATTCKGLSIQMIMLSHAKAEFICKFGPYRSLSYDTHSEKDPEASAGGSIKICILLSVVALILRAGDPMTGWHVELSSSIYADLGVTVITSKSIHYLRRSRNGLVLPSRKITNVQGTGCGA